MIDKGFVRRSFIRGGALATLAFLAGCAIVPKTTGPEAAGPATGPSPDTLPTDTERHRVALLVPLSGSNSAVGQSIANAATMALLDTNAQNLRVTTYDTSGGASTAAKRAIADGNRLILGPLLSEHIPAVAAESNRAAVPLISFSNDEKAARDGVYIMGNLPSQSVMRTVAYARTRGISSFAGLVPRGEYGNRASDALLSAARASGGTVVAMESYDRSNASIDNAARKLAARGGFGAVLIADGGRMAIRAAPLLKAAQTTNPPTLLGTELWSGEQAIASAPSLNGAMFAAVSDRRFGQFANSYRKRFGSQPYRIATLGYDSVLLTLRIARDWTVGRKFPEARLQDSSGFLGLDGPFRFGRNGVIERALEVREIRSGNVVVISAAPARFED